MWVSFFVLGGSGGGDIDRVCCDGDILFLRESLLDKFLESGKLRTLRAKNVLA